MSDPAPVRSWLEDYIEYTGQSEAPEVFHTWVGLSILSAVLRRKVWYDNGFQLLFPNLFVVLIAPPGKCRKSSAINIGTTLLRRIPGITVEANKVTTSALIDTLNSSGIQAMPTSVNGVPVSDDLLNPTGDPTTAKILLHRECTAALVSTEFSVLLGGESHQSGLIPILTDLYDSPSDWKYNTRGRGIEQLENVFLSLLAASTPEWLAGTIPVTAVGGGFTSRLILVVQHDRRKDNPRPKLTLREIALQDKLVDRLNKINALRGEIALDDEAGEYYDNWYRTERLPQVIDDRFAGYFERKQDHLIKVALLHAVAESETLVISKKHLLQALDCFDMIEHAMPEAFETHGTAITAQIPKLLHQIRDAGGQLDYSEIVRRNLQMISLPDMDIILHTMYAAGYAHEVVRGGTRYICLK